MQRAIELAKKGMGYVSPNPMVGCVVVKDDKIIAEGYHEKYGQYHAERNALLSCTEDTAGADLYVTLEPCQMCAGAIVLARVPTVVWGVSDPKRGGATQFDIFAHPGVNHHPTVVPGVLEEEARAGRILVMS